MKRKTATILGSLVVVGFAATLAARAVTSESVAMLDELGNPREPSDAPGDWSALGPYGILIGFYDLNYAAAERRWHSWDVRVSPARENQILSRYFRGHIGWHLVGTESCPVYRYPVIGPPTPSSEAVRQYVNSITGFSMMSYYSVSNKRQTSHTVSVFRAKGSLDIYQELRGWVQANLRI
jgi:hypothetical protein